MTLPSSVPISLSDVLAELRTVNPGRSSTISISDSDVRTLAGKDYGPVSLTDLLGKSSYVPMIAMASGDTGSNYNSQLNGGTVYCYPSVNVSGGRGARTFSWRIVNNPDSVNIANSNLSTCTVSKTFSKNSNGSASADVVCDVTDETGVVVTSNTVQAFLEWSNNA